MKLSYIHTLKLKKNNFEYDATYPHSMSCKKTLDFSLGALTDLVNNIKKSYTCTYIVFLLTLDPMHPSGIL